MLEEPGLTPVIAIETLQDEKGAGCDVRAFRDCDPYVLMAHLVRVDTGGGTVWLEASESAPVLGGSAIAEAASPRDAAQKAVETADQLQSSLTAFCGSVIDSLKQLGEDAKPSKATVEFGINVSLEGNVYVVRGSGAASIKVTAEWDLGGGQ